MSDTVLTTDTGHAIHLLPADAQGRWRSVRSVPFRLTITVPLLGLRLRNLQSLRAGAVFLTDTPAAEDVPVFVAGAVLGWGELDNVDGQMALRLTRLA